MSSTFMHILKKSAIHPYKIRHIIPRKNPPPAISHIYRHIYATLKELHAHAHATPPIYHHSRPTPTHAHASKPHGETPTPVNIMKMKELCDVMCVRILPLPSFFILRVYRLVYQNGIPVYRSWYTSGIPIQILRRNNEQAN